MAWVAVDKDGSELLSNNRFFIAIDALNMLIELNNNYKMYYNSCEGKWANTYSEGYFNVPKFNGVYLPQGSIEKLIGRKLTWEDEPVEIK